MRPNSDFVHPYLDCSEGRLEPIQRLDAEPIEHTETETDTGTEFRDITGVIGSAFALSPVAQAVVTDDLCLIKANNEFARLIGTTLDPVIDVPLQDVAPAIYDALRASASFKGVRLDDDFTAALRLRVDDLSADESGVQLVVTPISGDGLNARAYSLTLLESPGEMSPRSHSERGLTREQAARREAEVSAEIIEHILGITDLALAHVELEDLVRELLGRIREVLKADEAAILLLDPDEESLSLKISHGSDQLLQASVRIRIGEGYGGRVAATRQPLVLDDTSNFPFARRDILERGIHSLMGVPMLIGDRLLGVVHVGSTVPRHFNERDLHLMELAAARIALAVDRANLFEAERTARDLAEEAQHRNAFLASASEILSTSLDQRSTLRRIARFAVPEIADLCTINLVGEDGTVRLIASVGSTPEIQALVPDPRDSQPHPLAECPSIQSIVQTGATVFLQEVPEALIEQISTSPQGLEAARSCRFVSAMRVPMKLGGRVTGVMTFWLANTDRRYQTPDLSLAEDLAHRAALASANAALYEEAQKAIGVRNEFISIASHELKTPLTTVKGYVQLVRRHLQESPGDVYRVKRTLTKLQDQIVRFEELVNELLDVSRIQSGRIRLSYEDCDLSQIVRQVVERVEQTLEQEHPRGIHIIAPEGVSGRWDAARLDQVFTNLLSNALKYSPPDSEIEIYVEVVNASAEVSVIDHGIGIPADEHEQVFQPFMRGGVANGVAAGAGLGLYISREIVQRHGGSLTLISAPYQGSTFTVRLPLVPSGTIKSDHDS